jgi:hypothetical protein
VNNFNLKRIALSNRLDLFVSFPDENRDQGKKKIKKTTKEGATFLFVFFKPVHEL